ncbi:P-loop containing nucleoside triphosphate hydrolase protein [Coniochaeta sp. 2T2.1]|nr:P-loop containing nucleoside triphosphate hydrolase protein [Coniochaeta sp. 2T2.1]
MTSIQKRVGVTSDAVSAMVSIKLSGLAPRVPATIQRRRKEELNDAKRFRLMVTYATIAGYAHLLISPSVTFAVTGSTLTVQSVFTSLAYIQLLCHPLTHLFQVIPQLMAALTCIERIERFLVFGTTDAIDAAKLDQEHRSEYISVEDREDHGILVRVLPDDVSILVEDASSGWNPTDTVLHGVNLKVPSAKLTFIVGPVASGKSTLLKDDVLSELDRTAEEHVFRKVIGPRGFLCQIGTTIILATQATHYLSVADHIAVLGNRTVVEQGAFGELDNSIMVNSNQLSQYRKAKTDDAPSHAHSSSTDVPQVPHVLMEVAENKTRQQGDIAVYKEYFSRFGIPSVLTFFASGLVFAFLYNFGTIWLELWFAAIKRGDNRRQFFLGIYILIQVLCLVRMGAYVSFFGMYMAVRASLKTHNELLSTVLAAPLSFLTAVNAGVITNYFSQDISTVDNSLSSALSNTVLTGLTALGQAAVIATASPGKSSLVLLLNRLLEPNSGRITVDDRPLSSVRREVVRERIITLPQTPFFSSEATTVRESLVHLSNDPHQIPPPAIDSACGEALEAVGLWNIISSRGGLASEFTASTLSQGEKQLFSFARAVYRARTRPNPNDGGILLLDEFNLTVDTDTDSRMQAVIRREFAQYTVLCVAHRLDSVMDYDRVVVMDDGRIVETGLPVELAAIEGGRFRELLGAHARSRSAVDDDAGAVSGRGRTGHPD